MADGRHLGVLGRRLTGAFLLVSLVSLAVLFVGTVVPHLPDRHVDPHDPVSLAWLLVATAIAGLTAILLSVAIARRLSSPVEGYIATARQFAAGDHSVRPDEYDVPPEFTELVGALAAVADEIERSEMMRRQLTADIAHELRTPLAALQAGLEELRDGLIPADTESLAALHAQATRLGRIVNDLTDLAAVESTGIHLQSTSVDLSELARQAVGMRAGRLASAGLRARPTSLRACSSRPIPTASFRSLTTCWSTPPNTAVPGMGSSSGCCAMATAARSRSRIPDRGSGPRSCPSSSIGPGVGTPRMGRAGRASDCRSCGRS